MLAFGAFLGQLSQKLAVATDAEQIVRISTAAVADFLEVHRCYYFDVLPDGENVEVLPDWRRDGPDLAGQYDLKDFGLPEWRDAQSRGPLAINDVKSHPWTVASASSYPALQIQAYAVVPFVHEGRWVAGLGISSEVARVWTSDELGLLENVIARVWPLVQRARTTAALRESEERYRTLFESIDEGFCTIELHYDAQGKPVDVLYLQVNPAFERLTGLVGMVGRTARQAFPEVEEFWPGVFDETVRSGQARRFERHSAPLAKWFDIQATRVGSRRLATIFNDITERKRASEELAKVTSESEKLRRLYETILTSTPDLVYVWGLDHRFTYANQALLNMWGKNWESAIGRHCLELGYEPWHAAMHDEEIDRVVATRQPLRGGGAVQRHQWTAHL